MRDKTIQECLAACHDIQAELRGCSAFERSLRILGPSFYNDDANIREIKIGLAVLQHEISKPWWMR